MIVVNIFLWNKIVSFLITFNLFSVDILSYVAGETLFWPFFTLDILKNLPHFNISRKASNNAYVYFTFSCVF